MIMINEYLIRKKNDEHAFVSSIYRSSISHDNTPDSGIKFSNKLTAIGVAKHCEEINNTPYIVLVRTTTFNEITENNNEQE